MICNQESKNCYCRVRILGFMIIVFAIVLVFLNPSPMAQAELLNVEFPNNKLSFDEAPYISDIPDITTLEDKVKTVSFIVYDKDTPEDELIITVVSSNPELIPEQNIQVVGAGQEKELIITPAKDRYGSATITVTVLAGKNEAGVSFEVEVIQVNDPPSFDLKSEIKVSIGNYQTPSLANWATSISPGPYEEGQKINFILSGYNDEFFAVPPKINKNGTLTYQIKNGIEASTEVTVVLKDDGGTENGGIDTSEPQTFKILIDTLRPTGEIEYSPKDWTNGAVKVELIPSEEVEANIYVGNYVFKGNTCIMEQNGKVTFEFKDLYGNEAKEAISIIIDNIDKVPPESPVIVLSNDQWTKDDVTVSIDNWHDSISGIEYKQYRLNDGPWQEYEGEFAISTEGENIIEARATDKAGNTSTVLVTCKIDKTPPVISLISDSNNITKKSHSVVIAIDDISQIISSEYQWSESEQWPEEGEWKEFEPGDMITISGVTGRYYLHVRAIDEAGNITQLTSPVFPLDNTAPTVVLTGDHEDQIVQNGDIVKITATFSECVNNPQINIDLPGDDFDISGAAMRGNNNIWTYDWQVESSQDGEAVISVTAEDPAGNEYIGSQTLKYVIDNIAPVIVFPAIDNTPRKNHSVIIRIEDAVGVAKSEYQWSKSEQWPGEGEWKEFETGDMILISDQTGKFYLHIRAIDLAGNEMKKTSEGFILDNIAPIITLKGEDTLILKVGSRYIEPGAIAIDNYDGDITDNIIIEHNIDTSISGSYYVLYNVSDKAGNVAQTVTRTVNVYEERITEDYSPRNNHFSKTILDSSTRGNITLSQIDGERYIIEPLEPQRDVHVVLSGRTLTSLSQKKSNIILEIKNYMSSIELTKTQIDEIQNTIDTDLAHAQLDIFLGHPTLEKIRSIESQVLSLGGRLLRPVSCITLNVIDDKGKVYPLKNNNCNMKYNMFLPEQLDSDSVVGRWDEGLEYLLPLPFSFDIKDDMLTTELPLSSSNIIAVIDYRKSFDDLTSHWAKEDVEKLASKLIIRGRGNSNFEPEDIVSRAEFITMLVRALGITEISSEPAFKDIGKTNWYEKYVKAAYGAGLIKGFSDKSFRPQDGITREQAVVILVRAVSHAKDDGVEKYFTRVDVAADRVFRDSHKIKEWAKDSIDRAASMNLIKGNEKGEFNPDCYTTRAESAVMLNRLLNVLSFYDSM